MATRRRHAELVLVDTSIQLAPPGWYSGDTHEHVQACDETLHPIEEIRARMDAEDLNVANVLIWERVTLRYTQFVCRVNGQRDPSSGERRIIVYGVETSGLACARWGHLGGVVVATSPVALAGNGTALASFLAHEFPASAWVAARLASGRAQTSAVYVHVDGRPIADALHAEYWMLWCDLVAKTTLDHPELPFFGAQRDEALALIAKARRAFQTHRDVHGFDPSWNVTRYGRSSPGPRGPLAIGTTGPARTDAPFTLTCVHAPPLAQGTLYLSRAQDLAGTCDGEVRLHIDLAPANLVSATPALATRSGYAEVLGAPIPPGIARVFAQWVWNLPAGHTLPGCAGTPAARCASDALELALE